MPIRSRPRSKPEGHGRELIELVGERFATELELRNEDGITDFRRWAPASGTHRH